LQKYNKKTISTSQKILLKRWAEVKRVKVSKIKSQTIKVAKEVLKIKNN